MSKYLVYEWGGRCGYINEYTVGSRNARAAMVHTGDPTASVLELNSVQVHL